MKTKPGSVGPRPALAVARGILLTVGSLGCSGATQPEACSDGAAIPLAGGNCLVFDDGGRLDDHRTTVRRVVEETTTLIVAVMPITGVTIHVETDAEQTVPEQGIGGFAPNGQEVFLDFDLASPALTSSLENELGPTLAHEMHHARRWQTEGYGTSLLEAVVSEGLADHFSIEVFGIEPPIWSVAVSGADLDEVMALAEQNWDERPHDRARWFWGTTDPAIPRWAGYSIGFELVRAYLEANPTSLPSQLHDESAEVFLPS